MSIHWSDLNKHGRIEAVKAVYEPGMSASEIAAAIGGITRNAIIGLYGRNPVLALECSLRPYRESTGARKRPGRRIDLSRFANHLKPKTFEASSVPEPHLCGRPLMMVSSGQCWWPVNDAERGEQHLFCAEPTKGRYCDHHAARAYRVEA